MHIYYNLLLSDRLLPAYPDYTVQKHPGIRLSSPFMYLPKGAFMNQEHSLSAYQIFNTVAGTGNISQAAKELYISQPAISKAIAKLEAGLNVRLFTRNSRGVKLTEEGRLLYEYTGRAFEELRRGEESLRRITTLGIGHIRIGVSTTLCKYILLPYLKEFISLYPHIRISIQCQSTLHTLSLLESGSIDIGLIGRPNRIKPFEFYSLGGIEDVFVAAKPYLDNLCLRSGRRFVQDFSIPELFAQANIMLLDEQNITRQHIDDYLTQQRITAGQLLEISNMDLLIDFARIGLGIACVIREFIKADLDSGALLEIPLKHPIPGREIGFAHIRTAAPNEAVQKFLAFCRRELIISEDP